MTYFSRKVEISHFILPKTFLVIGSPVIHRVEDRAHGFAGFAERILHARRNLRVYGSRDYAIVLHGTQAICENLWLIPSRFFLSSLNLHDLSRRFLIMSSFHLLPISCTVVATGHSGSSSFVSIKNHTPYKIRIF